MTALATMYPNNVLGSDPGMLRDYAQAAEAAGYDRLILAEHVLGVHPDRPGGWDGPYDHTIEWQEPVATFGFLAAVTETIELMTGIFILPQRQTVLVAKQLAQLDVLSKGRIVLGVGTGWNAVEYDALGENFHTRGRRMDEQIKLLRMLWKDEVVTFEGEFDRVDNAGLNPRPPRRDIPIWMGGNAPRALDRIGKVGDGWFPLRLPRAAMVEGMERIRESAAKAGRADADIGLQVVIAERGDLDGQVAAAKRMEEDGATNVGFASQEAPLDSPQQHIDVMTRFAEAMRA